MNAWKKIEQKQFSPLYLLYGTESYIINETKQKLVANVLTEDDTDFNLSVYDLEETPVELAIEDAETFPFTGGTKLVILNNPLFLTGDKTKDKTEHNVKKLEQYIEDPSPYTILVLSGPYEKLDERKKLTKLLKSKAQVIEAKKLSEGELKIWVREQAALSGVQIDERAIDELLGIAGTDLARLAQELEKLSLYAAETNRIDVASVHLLTSRSLEQNVFGLVEKVVARNIDDALRIYYDLLKQNEEPIKILSVLAGQFRLIYQVKESLRRGYGQQQIAGMLKVHPFRVKLAAGQAPSFTEQELCEIIRLLAEGDMQMKGGGLAKEVVIELFLFRLNSLASRAK